MINPAMLKMKFNKPIAVMAKVLSGLYLFVFACYLFNYFMGTTMFVNGDFFPNIFMGILLYSMYLIVAGRYALELLMKRIQMWQLVYAVILFISGRMCLSTIRGFYGDYIFILTVLVIGALNIPYKDILYTYLAVKIPAFIYTFIASQTGRVVDLVYHRYGGSVRHSFGICYPTDFAAHVFYICTVWFLIRRHKVTYYEIGSIFVIVYFLMRYCDARTSCICFVVLACVLLVCKILYTVKLKSRIESVVSESKVFPAKIHQQGWHLISLIIPVLAICGLVIFSHSNYTNAFIEKLDQLLSHRIYFSQQAFVKYNLTWWGQNVIIIGNGGTLVSPKDYFFIDNSYLFLMMRYGVVMFSLLFGAYEIIIARHIKNYYVLGIIYVVMLHCMLEHHYYEFFYNVLLIMPLTDWSNETSNILSLTYWRNIPHKCKSNR